MQVSADLRQDEAFIRAAEDRIADVSIVRFCIRPCNVMQFFQVWFQLSGAQKADEVALISIHRQVSVALSEKGPSPRERMFEHGGTLSRIILRHDSAEARGTQCSVEQSLGVHCGGILTNRRPSADCSSADAERTEGTTGLPVRDNAFNASTAHDRDPSTCVDSERVHAPSDPKRMPQKLSSSREIDWVARASMTSFSLALSWNSVSQ